MAGNFRIGNGLGNLQVSPLAILAAAAGLALAWAAPASAVPADFDRKDWVQDLKSPEAMAFSPDGRLFVLEQAGKVRVIKNGIVLPSPFVSVNAWAAHRETMVGIAFDPDFAGNGYVYLNYQSNDTHLNRISRFTASKANPDLAEAGSELILLDKLQTGGHTGGVILFGKDGKLYIATGEGGGSPADPGNNGGKILRIDPAAYPDIIPKDNPFVGQPGAKGEVWAVGFREPYTGAVDPASGDILINDVGESTAEEIDLIKRGGHYGVGEGCEGACGKAGLENPWYSYGRKDGGCISGAAFYYGNAFPPEYTGSYFFGEYNFAVIYRRGRDGKVSTFDSGGPGKVIQLQTGPDGALYVLKIASETVPFTGFIQKIRYTGTAAAVTRYRPSAKAENPAAGMRAEMVRVDGRVRLRVRAGDAMGPGTFIQPD